MQGAFGATLATVASELPYEGEFRFLLDTRCGYHSFQSAGSFTYITRFSGEVFVVHAPLGHLMDNPFEDTRVPVPDILEDLRVRALFQDKGDFLEATGLSGVSDNQVITGFFTVGNASISIPLGSVATGPGIYVFP